jgi:hypothetical protein
VPAALKPPPAPLMTVWLLTEAPLPSLVMG